MIILIKEHRIFYPTQIHKTFHSVIHVKSRGGYTYNK